MKEWDLSCLPCCGCPGDCSCCPETITATISGLTGTCFGEGCGIFNDVFQVLFTGNCYWTNDEGAGNHELQVIEDGDDELWKYNIFDTCASWTVARTTDCPPATGWEWAGGECGEGSLTLSW